MALLCAMPWCISAQGDESGLQAGAMRVLIVFDASQSMYGKLEDSSQSKLNLAKGLMETTLESWPEDVQLGLLAYGHRGRRAPGRDRCRDIELLVSVAPGTAKAVCVACRPEGPHLSVGPCFKRVNTLEQRCRAIWY
jgi:hypothetical protein